jgi:integrase
LNDAQRRQLVTQNAAELSEPIRVEKQAQNWLTDKEARALLQQVRGDRLEALYVLCLATGLRRGEALGLSWKDVDLDKGTIHIRNAAKRVQTLNESGPRTRLEIGPTKTKSSNRTTVLPELCIDSLKKHRAIQSAERLAAQSWQNPALVFTTPVGSIVDPANFSKRLSVHCVAAGLGHRNPHQLRHSCATLLLAEEVPLHEVSEILGHSSVSVTKDVYGHLTPERRRAAAEAMDRVLAGNQ